MAEVSGSANFVAIVCLSSAHDRLVRQVPAAAFEPHAAFGNQRVRGESGSVATLTPVGFRRAGGDRDPSPWRLEQVRYSSVAAMPAPHGLAVFGEFE